MKASARNCHGLKSFCEAGNAHIFAGVQLRNGTAERRELLQEIATAGYTALDLSDNEMAKLHVRHMVGGRSSNVTHERLYRFEFPERPGALLDFLDAMFLG
jgi:threonine dehydratase